MIKSRSTRDFVGSMPPLKIALSEELDQKFRDAIYKSKGMKRGNIKAAAEEAIKMWISAQENKERE